MATGRKKTIYFSVGLFFVILALLHFLGLTKPIEEFLRSLFKPFLSSIQEVNVRIGDNYQYFANKNDFIEEYKKSQIKSEVFDVMTADVKRLAEENAELRKQLNFFQKKSFNHLLADVVGKELSTFGQTLIVDKGSDEGVEAGDPVLSGSGILIGKILKTEKRISYIKLLNDNSSRIGATVLNKDKSLGVIEGGFGISLKMNLIPRDEIILVNDEIVTSGLENKTPRGLLIGSVAEVENEPYKPFQQAVVTPATDYSKLSTVSILIIR